MSFGGTYSTGTVSTDTGSPVNERALIFSGSLLGPNVEQGDMFWAAGAIGFISSIDDDTHITLYSDWTGPALDAADYVIFKTSWLRVDAAITQEKTRQLLAALDAQGIILFVAGDVPDPGMGEDGQWALKTNGGPWKLWLKVSGVWVLQGVPVSTKLRGAWDSATAYNANDLASRNGTTYGALVDNTNVDPATDDGTHWVVFAARGIDGGQGGGCAWVQTFSTSTANSDPGDGMLRLNNLAQDSATILRIDYLDINGGDISSLAASLAAGTSPVKGSIRISERGDLSRWMAANVTAVQNMSGYFNVTIVVTRAPDASKLLRDAQPIVVQFTPKGDLGNTGNTGAQGNAGWSPVFSLVSDSERRVLKIVDWAGGAGTKPAINKYVGGSGLVDAVGDGLDIRGAQGLKGDTGDQGQGIQPDATGSLTDRATHDAATAGYIFMQTDVTPFVLYVKNSATSGDWSDGSSLGSGTVVASDVTNDSDITGATVTEALNALVSTTINGHDLSSDITLDADDIGDGATNKAYTATEKSKLSGISAGADVTGTATHAATSKTTPVDNDEIGLIDSAASNALKKLTWANLKATLSSTWLTSSGYFREKLSANRVYYVRSDGSDSNNGLANTSGGAFLTIQKAIDTAIGLDLSIYSVTIQLNGNFTESPTLKSYIGAGPITIVGDETTPSNVTVTGTGSQVAVFLADGIVGKWVLAGLKLTHSGTGKGLLAAYAGSVVEFRKLEFGSATNAQIQVDTGALISLQDMNGYSISGGAPYHAQALRGGIIKTNGLTTGSTVTLSGTPAFSTAFAGATIGGLIRAANTYSGSATGVRYTVDTNGVISTGGGGASFLPGSSAGTTATGGQYA